MMNNNIGRNRRELSNNELNQVSGGLMDNQREDICLAEESLASAVPASDLASASGSVLGSASGSVLGSASGSVLGSASGSVLSAASAAGRVTLD